MGRRTSKEKPREIKCNRCQEVFEDSHKRDRRRRVCVKIIPNKKLMRLQARIRLAEDANAQFIEKAERRAAAAERARQSPDNVPEQLVEKSDEETGEKHFRISIVVIGHVDSGKSTTTGHLIYKLGRIDPCVLERYEKEAADMNKQSYKYSWILDKLKAERERGISIDISLLRFQITNYRCTVIDKPGHRDFLKNMITGASQADCAMLVIDATAGAFEASMLKDGQTREHATLASVLGVKQIICCCNKTKVKPVEMHGQVLSEAVAGDMIGFSSKHLYTNEVKVKRGDVVSNTKDHPAKGATRFTSQIILLDYPGKIKEGYTPLLHCHTSRTPVRFSELTSKIDKQTHEPIESKQEYLTGKDSALVKMQAIKPLVVEPFDEYPPLGRFAVRDSRQTVAVGVIKTVDKVTEGKAPAE